MTETIIVTVPNNEVIVQTPGPQGQRGRGIINGNGAPADNLGLEGDFYYDKDTTRLTGPKLLDGSWAGAYSYILQNASFFEYSWTLLQLTGPVDGMYSLVINHNLGYNPGVTVKTVAGDILEVGIAYNTNKKLTIEMAQPFAGIAYLS